MLIARSYQLTQPSRLHIVTYDTISEHKHMTDLFEVPSGWTGSSSSNFAAPEGAAGARVQP